MAGKMRNHHVCNGVQNGFDVLRAGCAPAAGLNLDEGPGPRLDDEAVASMKWPAMTMSFKAKDKKALQALKPGQKIEFDFVEQGKDHVITKVK